MTEGGRRPVRRRLSQTVRGGGAIALAIGVMNVATYGYTILAAWLLGPQRFGAFAALMATLLVLSVLALGLQATAARIISTETDAGYVARVERTVLRLTYRLAWGLGAVVLALTPLLGRVLRIDDWLPVALVAVVAVPMTMMGGQAGVLQGERRWVPLALVYLAAGVPRLVVGTLLLLLRPEPDAAMLGVALGAIAPAVVGAAALRRRVRDVPPDDPAAREHPDARALAWEAARNIQALLAFFALSNLDVIVARNVLPPEEAGRYAAGLILTKAVLFLPQFVVVVAYPSLATPHQRAAALRRSLAAVGALGALATAGAATLSGLAVLFVGGQQYAGVQDSLWLFAALGTALAALQLLVYSMIARQDHLAVGLVWLGLAVLVLAGSAADSPTALVTTVLGVDLVLVAVLLVRAYRADAVPAVLTTGAGGTPDAGGGAPPTGPPGAPAAPTRAPDRR